MLRLANFILKENELTVNIGMTFFFNTNIMTSVVFTYKVTNFFRLCVIIMSNMLKILQWWFLYQAKDIRSENMEL